MSTVLDKLKNKLKHKPVVHDFKPVEIIFDTDALEVATKKGKAGVATKKDKEGVANANVNAKITIVDKRADNDVNRGAILANLQRNMQRHHIPTVYNEPVLDAEVHIVPAKDKINRLNPEKVKKAKKVVIIDEADKVDDDNADNIVQIDKAPVARITKAPVKGAIEIGPEILLKIGDTAIPDRIPRKAPHVNIKVDSYYMNNREKFISFINSIFEPYHEELETKENISCDNLGGNATGGLLTHQKLVRDYMNLYTPYRGLLVAHSLGSGKCHARGTPIMLADGRIKKVENIMPGDFLMGDDSTPRRVLSIAQGRDTMYDIIPVKGDKYTVNSDHILCLRCSNNAEVIEISVKEYLKLDNFTQKGLKGYKVGIELPYKDTPIIPYCFGCVISSTMQKMPDVYKYNSFNVRAQVLAGILDCSTLQQTTNAYKIRNPFIVDDVIYLAQSLGIQCYQKDESVLEFVGALNKIPTRCVPLISTDDDLTLDIIVKEVAEDDYFGFTLDGNGRFLLGDFTVTHNTATSIAIAEGMKTSKKVVVLTPASLRMNYIEELKRFGDELYRKNQYWEWVSVEQRGSKATAQEIAQTLAKVLNLSLEYVTRRKGAWFINVKKAPNFGTLSAEDKKAVDEQLNEMIQAKYTFINYNGLRYSKLRELTADFTVNLFDNAVVIIDEAHNLISRIVNKIKMDPAFAKKKETVTKKPKERPQPRFIATRLYEDLMAATNARVVLLSGTPIINYPNEFAILYNILRGYIKTWSFQLSIKTADKVTANKLRELLQTEKTLDYLDYSPSSKTLTLTRNPFGFRNVYRGQNYVGVADRGAGTSATNEIEIGPFISDEQFERNITRILGQHQIDVVQNSKQITNYKALPDDFESFAERFINPNTKELLNVNALKRRILGLTSYYKSAQLSLLPRYNKTLGEDYHIVRIPMSDFQFGIYETARAGEREVEKRARKPKKQGNLEELYEQNTSTYRIFSRLYCNYVMANRPMPTEEERKERIAKKKAKKEQDGGDRDSDRDSDSDSDSDNDTMEPELAILDDIQGGAERCPPGTRRNKKTGKCEPTMAAVPVLAPAAPLATMVADEPEPEPEKKKRIVRKKVVFDASPLDPEPELPMIEPPLKGKKAIAAAEEELAKEEIDEDLEATKEGEVEGDEVLENMGGVYYKEQIIQIMQRIEQNPDEYLSKTALQSHSPKFLTMLENIQDTDYKGLHLVYSQFRTLEGIGIFSLVLDHNGFTRFRLSKNESTGQWKINMDEIRKRGFPTYALYTGTETAEEKEIIRNIYNGDWDMVPTNLVADLKSMSANNNLGEIIKVFMITSSGSEGINLRNTRYVHVMEPYWHPVRVEQVIGRARRICSHKGLPEELRTVEVFIYLMIFSEEQLTSDKSIELRLHDKGPLHPDAGPVTSDQYLFEVSEIKAVIAGQLTQVSQESSFDCSIYNSGDAKGANGKALKCMNFANPSIDDFTYVPDYLKQENDVTAQMNTRRIEWKAVPVTISGIEYAARLVAPDKYEIYNFISYQKGNPVQVGTLEKIAGKMVFNPIVR